MLNGGVLPIVHDKLIENEFQTNQMKAYNEIIKIKKKYSLQDLLNKINVGKKNKNRYT